MDTFKEKQRLDDMVARGETPWELWKRQTEARAPSTSLVIGAATQGLRPLTLPNETSPTEQRAHVAA
jgi:hypothetical protein